MVYDNDTDLTLLPFHWDGTWYWHNVSPYYHPWISADHQCPASIEYPGYDASAVRRWVSNVEGMVHVEATMHRDYGAPYGMGSGFYNSIWVDYAMLSSIYLSQYDYSTYVVHLDLAVAVGTVIDFVTSNASTNNYSNNPYFAAVITPEPATSVALCASGLWLLRRRRR